MPFLSRDTGYNLLSLSESDAKAAEVFLVKFTKLHLIVPAAVIFPPVKPSPVDTLVTVPLFFVNPQPLTVDSVGI